MLILQLSWHGKPQQLMWCRRRSIYGQQAVHAVLVRMQFEEWLLAGRCMLWRPSWVSRRQPGRTLPR